MSRAGTTRIDILIPTSQSLTKLSTRSSQLSSRDVMENKLKLI